MASFRLRFLHLALGLAYSSVLMLALVRSRSVGSTLMAFALIVASYAKGIVVPDVAVTGASWTRVCGVGFLVLLAGVVAVVFGGSDALGWAVAVMAICAGNRFKAGGLGYREL